MTFKANWEKTSTKHQLPQNVIEKMVLLAYPNKKLIFHELIAGGCSNLNIKIQLATDPNPFILRVYFHDRDASYREQKLGQLLKPTVPVPLTYYIGEMDGYHFAVTEFMPGIPLRDLLLSDIPHDIGTLMYDIGTVLSKITAHKFPKSGFFDKDLTITREFADDFALNFAKECLRNDTIICALNTDVVSQINDCLDRYGAAFPNPHEKHLVHADFDPANILVDKVDETWKISGILDWEFAFSGSGLYDIANMLRYAHKMPPEFQDAFLKGLESNRVKLPKNWRISAHMANMLSLLDCLIKSDPQTCPNQCTDIRELIKHILKELEA